MSIYFAYTPDSNRKQSVSNAVRERGLELLRAKPSAVNITPIVLATQPAYASYVSNIHAFMYATATGRTTWTGRSMIRIPCPEEALLPFTMPKLIYEYRGKITEAVRERSLHAGAAVQQRGRTGSAFFMDDPTVEKVRQLMTTEPIPRSDTRHIAGSMNVRAYKVALMLQGLLTAFLNTHVYAAFRNKEALEPGYSPNLVNVNKRRKLSSSAYLGCMTNEALTQDVDVGEEKEEGGNSDERPTPTIILQRAKPTESTESRWGLSANIPNADGLFFPYVADLAVHDERTVPDLVSRYFVKCLADDIHATSNVMNELTAAWGVLRETTLGGEMSHLCRCIEIALQSQTAVYPIYTNTNKYEGCVVWGTGYQLLQNGMVHNPISYNKLLDEVRDKSMHSSALAAIEGIIGDSYSAGLQQCTSIRELSNNVQECRLSVGQQQEVVKYASRLCYDNRYWGCQTIFIKRMFRLYTLLKQEEVIPFDTPMHPSMLFSTDPDELVLSAFGYQAPTFLIPNGKRLPLKEKNNDDLPTSFHTRMVELAKAVSDMKYIRGDGYITNDNRVLSTKHRDLTIKGADKKEIWNMLVEEVSVSSKDDGEEETEETNEEVQVSGDSLFFGF